MRLGPRITLSLHGEETRRLSSGVHLQAPGSTLARELGGCIGPAIDAVSAARGRHMTRIYVGNLPFEMSDEELRELFVPYGEITTCDVVADRDTGRSRGFGFMEMNGADAARAIEALDGQDAGGRALRVNEARERR